MKYLLFFLIVISSSLTTMAQSVSGSISDENGKPLTGVTVRFLVAADTAKERGAITNLRGNFTIKNMKAGEYLPRINYLGYSSVYGASIAITGNIRYDATLRVTPIQLDNLVVTASRVAEKASEAPASTSVVELRQIQNTNAVSSVEHLRGIAGADIAQSGLGQQTVVLRGFSNVFSGQMMMLTDYRNAGVPSLRANISYLATTTEADIDRIEVVRGPGSALYGPNAANGVVNIITKSPFSSKGTIVELTGGERSLFSVTARHAGAISDNFGFKISGNYTRGMDWAYYDSTEQFNRQAAIIAGAKSDSLIIGKRDPIFERAGLDGRMNYLLDDDAQITLQAGYSVALRSVELTDISAAQAKNWGFGYALARLDYERLIVQSFVNFSNSGQTFLLRSGNPIVDHSKQIVARIQNSTSWGKNQEFTYGGDMFLTRPETERTIMGENENNDAINEFGGYLQSKSTLFDNLLDIVIAGRYDYNNRLNDGIFSPRVAFVLKPLIGQTFRAAYNTGYSAPYPFDLFADIRYTDNAFRSAGFPDAFGPAVYVKGSPPNGLKFLRDATGAPLFRSTFLQDRTQTLSLSSIGILWDAATPFVQNAVRKDTTFADDVKDLIISFLGQTHASAGDNIGGLLKLLNNATEKFDAVANAYDANALKPTITRSFEVGYAGIISEAFRASVDVYSTKITNFISSSRAITPNVFFNPADAIAFLTPRIKQKLIELNYANDQAALLSALLAQRLGEGYAEIPVGTAAVAGASDPTAILFAPRNFGEVNLWGSDISFEFRPNSSLTFAGSYSFVSQDLFNKVDSIADISLNAPKHKASFAINYDSEDKGFGIGARWRWNGGFEMVSGVFNGIVEPYNIADISISTDVPAIKGLRAVLTVNNAFDFLHREFIGAPYLGRMTTLRVSRSF